MRPGMESRPVSKEVGGLVGRKTLTGPEHEREPGGFRPGDESFQDDHQAL